MTGKPTLLWVRMSGEAGSEASMGEFARRCHVLPVEQQHLWAAAALASASDVICFDYDHPSIEGLRFAAETKGRFPSLPIVMVISQQSADIVLWALRTRVFDVIARPISAQDVVRVVERLAPVLTARRSQSTRKNATGVEAIPEEARYRLRDGARHKLKLVCEHIAKHYTESIGEIAMAKLCGMSPFRFSRSFRVAFGVTFRDYLSECRLTHAKRLLGNAQVSVTDVAAMVGFNDPSYFARLFKKRTGVSPTGYRVALAEGALPTPEQRNRA
jgi:AraC-like DNA-binding protein/CheY-like chemotaxis protein